MSLQSQKWQEHPNLICCLRNVFSYVGVPMGSLQSADTASKPKEVIQQLNTEESTMQKPVLVLGPYCSLDFPSRNQQQKKSINF